MAHDKRASLLAFFDRLGCHAGGLRSLGGPDSLTGALGGQRIPLMIFCFCCQRDGVTRSLGIFPQDF